MLRSIVTISVLATCSLSACRTATGSGGDTKSVDDIAAVTNNKNMMTVVCKNGATSEYTSADFRQRIADNSICSGGGGSQSEWMCVAYNSATSQIARISSGKTYGTNVTHQNCQQIIKAARNSLICEPYNSDTSQIFGLNGENTSGTNTTHAICNDLVRNSTGEIVCLPYNSDTSQIFRIAKRQTTGTNVAHNICMKLSASARNGLVCVPYNSDTSQLTRLSDGQTLGTNIPHQQCIDNLSSM